MKPRRRRILIAFSHVQQLLHYIVASCSRTLYIGVTSNLERRVWQHKTKAHEGFSATYNCNRLVWFESYSHAGTAIAREKELKGRRRVRKIELIVNTNPA